MILKNWALGVLLLSGLAPAAHAFDRQDGSQAAAVNADPSTDILDFYAWMDPTAKRLNLVMTVFPNADKTTSRFSSENLYVFHTIARTAFSNTAPAPDVQVICRFDGSATQNFECWAGKSEYIKSQINAAPQQSRDRRMTAWAGPRNDPFFMNQAGLDSAMNGGVASIAARTQAGSRDAAGCHAFSPPEVNAVKAAMAVPPTDTYLGQNVLAIIVQVDASLLVSSGAPILSLWASTNKAL